MSVLLVVTGVFLLEMAGRIATLVYMMHHSEVKCGSYRTWVLVCVFIPLAWAVYLICGRGQKPQE